MKSFKTYPLNISAVEPFEVTGSDTHNGTNFKILQLCYTLFYNLLTYRTGIVVR